MQSVPNWRPCRASSAKATQCFVTRRTGWPATLITYENSAGSDGARCPYRLCEGKLDLHWRRSPMSNLLLSVMMGALATADKAFVSWATRPERGKIIFRAAPLLLERKSELAKLATLEMGT